WVAGKMGGFQAKSRTKAARPKELRALFEVFQDGEGAFPWGGIPAFGRKFHTRTAWIGVKGQCELLQDRGRQVDVEAVDLFRPLLQIPVQHHIRRGGISGMAMPGRPDKDQLP